LIVILPKTVEERNKAMKTDLRVRYTRKVIQEAFWALLKEKSLEKVTVKEVCELAQINRGTFYKHYLDCYDLLDKMQDETIAQLEQHLASMETQGAETMLTAFLRALQGEKETLRVLSGRRSDAFLHRVALCCYRSMEKQIAALPGMAADAPFHGMNYAFLAGGCASVIEYWTRTEMREPPEVVAGQLLRLSGAFLTGLGQKASVQ